VATAARAQMVAANFIVVCVVVVRSFGMLKECGITEPASETVLLV